MPPSAQCGFAGNSDIYGLGIRLGIYLQLLATFLANYFVHSEAQVLWDGAALFSVAMFISSIYMAANPKENRAVEVYLVIHMMTWATVVGVRKMAIVYSVSNSRSGLLRRGLNEMIQLSALALHVWFWWKGLDVLQRTPCGTYMMVFTKLDMYGWIRTAMKVLSITGIVSSVISPNTNDLKRLFFLGRMKGARQEFLREIAAWREYDRKKRLRVTTDDQISLDVTFSTSPTFVSTSFVDEDELGNSAAASAQFGFLEEVYSAELFIQHCFAASPFATTEEATSNHPSHVWGRTKAFFWSTGKWPSELHCRIYNATHTLGNFPVAVLHMETVYHGCLKNGPYRLYAALTYRKSKHELPDWHTVMLAACFQIQGRPKNKALWWYRCISEFAFYTFVVVQLELTIHWNTISGVTALWKNVGQLIPFIIGLGGLVMVVLRGVREHQQPKRRVVSKINEDVEGKTGVEGDGHGDSKQNSGLDMSNDVKEDYKRWREAYKKSIESKTGGPE